MSFSRNKYREAYQSRAQKQQQQTMIKVAAGSAIVLLVVITLWVSNASDKQPVDHFVDYDTALVVNDMPIQAVHEMNGLDTGSIPFLPEGGPQPNIVVEQNFFDFKQVGASDVVQHEFVIRNDGDAPLTISRAFSTCACTTAYFTASVIPPGKIAIMTLTFDAGYHDVRGQTVRRGIIIESNDPDQPETEIWTQATVRTTP
jgi:hypothetical protein